YNGKLDRIAKSFIVHKDSSDGYEPLFNKMKATPGTTKKSRPSMQPIVPYSDSNFNHLLGICKERGLNLIVTTSPRFRPKDTNDYLRARCKAFDIPYIEMYNDAYFNEHPELFHDAAHLNDEGAHLYTKLFFKALKKHLDTMPCRPDAS
ncbi:MAG: hypothetical protein RLY31_730, partial [Bacteroidota bacterium]